MRLYQKKPKFIVIDEIQKVPKLLDVVHYLIQKKSLKFALTGSSARKLKYGGANLLAGRAFLYRLYPLTFLELGRAFHLKKILQKGSLPTVFHLKNAKDQNRFLYSYVQNYLKEEIVLEQVIRNLNPFRYFLEVAGQCNGHILNYVKMGRQAGIDHKSCKRYFEILEDTFLGFHLPAFSRSIRKQQAGKPKFYLFDLGVARALCGLLDSDIVPSTYAFGNCFEHLVICEAYRLNEYFETQYRFSYFRSKDGLEVDLILQKGNQIILVEIKSTSKVLAGDLKALKMLKKDLPKAKAYVFSLQETAFMEDGIHILNWKQGLQQIFLKRKLTAKMT